MTLTVISRMGHCNIIQTNSMELHFVKKDSPSVPIKYIQVIKMQIWHFFKSNTDDR